MLRTRALKKIFITTLSMFILLTVFSLPTFKKETVLRTNLEVEEKTTLKTNSIYLLNKDNYLVKTKIFIEATDKEDKIREILNNLIIKKNNKLPAGLNGTIPSETTVQEVIVNKDIVTIDFSKEILKVQESLEKQMITSIVYSLLELKDLKGVIVLVNGNTLLEYPNSKEKLPSILDKKIGINNKYLLTSRDNISKVVIYYLEDIEENLYYVPVTKYINDNRDKIKIIIEELTTNYIYEPNLMSFLDNKVELLDYHEENDVLFLNFNDYLYNSKDKILEEVLYSIAYSVFDNYNVNMVMFEVNEKEVKYISKKDI